MRHILYYPGFEVEDINYLKFALLYVDKLDTIIPESGNSNLTDLHHRLVDETDLIHVHRPEYDEGQLATQDAVEHIEDVLRHPALYEDILGEDFTTRWAIPNSQKYKLFEGKYVSYWSDFCRDHGFAQETNRGLMLPQDLGLIYMTVLAHAISDSRDVPAMTDNIRMSKLGQIARTESSSSVESIRLAQSIIDIKVPGDLGLVPISDVIALRNRPGFADQRSAFHAELEKVIEAAEGNDLDPATIASFKRTSNEFLKECLQVGTGVATFGLGMWLLIQSPDAAMAEFVKEALGGCGLSITSYFSIKPAWKNTCSRRLARKYLAEISRLKPIALDG